MTAHILGAALALAIGVGCSGSGGGPSAATGSGGSATAGTGGGGPAGAAGGGAGAGASGGSGGGGGGGAAAGSGGSSAGGTGGSGGSGGGPALTLPASSLAVRFANAVMTRWPDARTINGAVVGGMPAPAFEYNVGIVLRGIQAVYEKTNDARYLTYIQRYVDAFITTSNTVNVPAGNSFDNLEPGNLVLFLLERTGTAKYQAAADYIRGRYNGWPVNADGGFWHKDTYPNQMWLDSIFMAEPFLARYGALVSSCGTYCVDTPLTQMTLIAAHVRDPATGLLYHAWDDSPAGMKAAWADATTGRSPVIWGRALGWYAMSLVDVLPFMPDSDTRKAQLLDTLRSLAVGLKNTQDPSTGLWRQVVDMGTRSDDYLETSGSGMFVYALRLAIRRGYIDAATYQPVADKGWSGLQTMVTTDATGPVINGAVTGMGVQASYALYVNQTMFPKRSNSSHGLCAILLAASEMEAQ